MRFVLFLHLVGMGMIASPHMLNDKHQTIQIPRIYNISRIHDSHFYFGNSFKIRNEFLEKDGYIDGFEYMSYLSKDVLNPLRNYENAEFNHPLLIYPMSQDCRIVTFCGEKAIISTFRFS